MFHLDVRALTAEERDEYGIEDTTIGEDGEEHPQLAYTDNLVIYRHDEPLTAADYGKIVSLLVRAHYSEDQVEAITQNYIADSSRLKAYADWQNLQSWRAEAKRLAKQAIGIPEPQGTT